MTWHAVGSYYLAKAQYNKVIVFVFSCYTVAEEADGVGGGGTFRYRDVLRHWTISILDNTSSGLDPLYTGRLESTTSSTDQPG